jgi:hypothetical protein
LRVSWLTNFGATRRTATMDGMTCALIQIPEGVHLLFHNVILGVPRSQR